MINRFDDYPNTRLAGIDEQFNRHLSLKNCNEILLGIIARN